MTESGGNAVAVIGAGGHAKVVISTLQAAGHIVSAVFDDDRTKLGTALLGVPVRGPVSDVLECHRRAVIAIGKNSIREELSKQLDQFGQIEWVAAVHPAAYVHQSVKVGPGAVVFAGAVIQPDATVGAHSIINTGATVDHDCIIGDFVHIAPGVHLAGGVRVGRGAFLGIGAAVIPYRSIGEWTIVGAGGLVIHDAPARLTLVGVPAVPLRKSERICAD